MMSLRVVIQARPQVFRDALARVLDRESDLEVVGSVATPAELVDLCRRCRPEVAVLATTSSVDDPAAARALRRRGGVRRVVCLALGTGTGAPEAGAGLEGGAGLTAVLGRIRQDDEARTTRADGLSPREAQVLRLIGYGLTSDLVARYLGIGRGSVDRHRRRICKKMGARTPAHAVALAMASGPRASGQARRVVGR